MLTLPQGAVSTFGMRRPQNIVFARGPGTKGHRALWSGVTDLGDQDVPALSLAAMAAKWAGWKVGDNTLQERTLVMRPLRPTRARLGRWS